MDKIILSKRVAVALEKALSNNLNNKAIVLKTHADILFNEDLSRWKGDNYKYLNELSLEDMAIALYVGYEVEETPEEKILIKYEEFKEYQELRLDDFEDGFCVGIEFCLDALGIEIKGINK